jgi:hypothetical protein
MTGLYPEIKNETVQFPSEEELVSIAKAIVGGYDSDGSDWPPYVTPEDGEWETFEESYKKFHQLRMSYGLSKAIGITVERKQELKKILYSVKKADEMTKKAVSQSIKEIDESMELEEDNPTSKLELDSVVSSKIIDPVRMTRTYMDYRCKSPNVLFTTFSKTYEKAKIVEVVK